MVKIYINGRFLTKALTGVQRTALEIVIALDNLLDCGEIDKKKYNFILIYSGDIINSINLKHIKLQRKGWLKGNLWEQFELPILTYRYLLISICTVSTIFKRKQIVVVHDASFVVNPQFFSKGFKLWYGFIMPILAIVAKQIVTVSNFSKNELVKHADFKEDKISVIYNSADHLLRFGKPEITFANKIDELKPYCLAVSSLGANKNFKTLSSALEKINFSNYQMLIAGGLSKVLKQIPTNKNITYLGYVSDAELRYLYENASLFIFPSFYEGFGIPPLEAMFSGCPVISSSTSSLPEVLNDACLYFNPYDADELADKIQDLLNDEYKLKILAQKGLHRANQFAWKKSAIELMKLISKFN